MNIEITGKGVVVTGAVRGIGRALALGLAAEGARVLCWHASASGLRS